MPVALALENVGKHYRLGSIGNRTLHQDLNRWWAGVRGRPDPLLRIGEAGVGPGAGEALWALRGVSLQVDQGEVVGIIGRNGAGKSTLLKILSQVTAPTEGLVKVRGRIASLLEVGTGFHPDLTGRENTYLNGAIMGMTKAEISRKFDEIVDFSGVERFIDTPVKRYSSGMYVRLAFAVAAHLEPEILLVDEVLAVGDAGFQKKCLGKMGSVASAGRTVLFVSHQLGQVAALCPRCLLVERGRVARDEATPAVVGAYLRSLQESAQTGLRERTDRQGTGRIRFLDAWVEDGAGERSERVMSGDAMKLVASYEVAADDALPCTVVCGAGVFNSLGVWVTDVGTQFQRAEVVLNAKRGRIEFAVPRLTLNPGSFSYNLIVRSGHAGHEVHDLVEHAGTLVVEPGDFFGSGQIIPANRSIFVLPHDCRLREEG